MKRLTGVLLGVVGKTMTEDEWRERRHDGIGGSDSAAIMGCSDYATPLSVYLDKVDPQPNEQNEFMRWGHLLEPVVIAEFTRVTGLRVTQRQRMYQHPEYPWMFATVDGLTKRGLFEGKTTSAYSKGWDGDEPPLAVWVQCQHNMAVTGAQASDVACLQGGNHFLHFEVARDDAFIEQLIAMESALVVRIKSETPPPVTGSDIDTAILAFLNPGGDSEVLEMPPNVEEWIDGRMYANSSSDALDAERVAFENQIKQFMGDHEEAAGERWTVTWRPNKNGVRNLKIKETPVVE